MAFKWISSRFRNSSGYVFLPEVLFVDLKAKVSIITV